MASRGLKRICTSCGMKFYDMGKVPVICPACGTEFTGEIEVKTRRSRSAIAPDTVKREDIEAKNLAAGDDDETDLDDLDDETISLDDLEEDNSDDDLDGDDDLSDLDGDIDLDVEDDR